MNTLLIIGACLLGSAVVQFVIFYIYSAYQRNKILRSHANEPLQGSSVLKPVKSTLFHVDFISSSQKNSKSTAIPSISGKSKAAVKLYSIGPKPSQANSQKVKQAK